MNNGRPISKRKAARMLVALTLLAWATQTLLHQWGYGDTLPPDDGGVQANAGADVGDMKFVSGGDVTVHGTLELRPDATVASGDVQIRNVCRWSGADAGLFQSVADLTVAHLTGASPCVNVTVDDVRQTLTDAGMNVAAVEFSGATKCQVSAGEDFVQTEVPAPASASATAGSASAPEIAPSLPPPTDHPSQQLRSLRDLLRADLISRLQLPADSLQVTFSPTDDGVLNLVEPYFEFSISPRRVNNLGDVSWSIDITRDGQTQRQVINATARQWQTQQVLQRPVDYRQVIQDTDVTEKRTLVDRLPDAAILTHTQVVGMQASRILKPGTVLTGEMVDPVLLATTGQLVTIEVSRGTVHVTTVARAMESGSFGETIRVRDESSPPQIYEVTLTGPQRGTLSAAN